MREDHVSSHGVGTTLHDSDVKAMTVEMQSVTTSKKTAAGEVISAKNKENEMSTTNIWNQRSVLRRQPCKRNERREKGINMLK